MPVVLGLFMPRILKLTIRTIIEQNFIRLWPSLIKLWPFRCFIKKHVRNHINMHWIALGWNNNENELISFLMENPLKDPWCGLDPPERPNASFVRSRQKDFLRRFKLVIVTSASLCCCLSSQVVIFADKNGEKKKSNANLRAFIVVRLQFLSIFTCLLLFSSEETQSRQWIAFNSKAGVLAPRRPSSLVLNSTMLPGLRLSRTSLNSWLAIRITSLLGSSVPTPPPRIMPTVTSNRWLSKRFTWQVCLARALSWHNSSSSCMWSSMDSETGAGAASATVTFNGSQLGYVSPYRQRSQSPMNTGSMLMTDCAPFSVSATRTCLKRPAQVTLCPWRWLQKICVWAMPLVSQAGGPHTLLYWFQVNVELYTLSPSAW